MREKDHLQVVTIDYNKKEKEKLGFLSPGGLRHGGTPACTDVTGDEASSDGRTTTVIPREPSVPIFAIG